MKNSKKQTPYIVSLIFVLIAALLCSLFCFQLLLIQGESMEPTYRGGQFAFIIKLDRDYTHGDCILFHSESLGQNLVKRIVALPGDTVQIQDGALLINGKAYLPYPGCPEIEFAGLAAEPLSIPEDCCFVLGDNFSRSIDSRHAEVGLVKMADIKGKII